LLQVRHLYAIVAVTFELNRFGTFELHIKICNEVLGGILHFVNVNITHSIMFQRYSWILVSISIDVYS
jgi:hypothetical protein